MTSLPPYRSGSRFGTSLSGPVWRRATGPRRGVPSRAWRPGWRRSCDDGHGRHRSSTEAVTDRPELALFGRDIRRSAFAADVLRLALSRCASSPGVAPGAWVARVCIRRASLRRVNNSVRCAARTTRVGHDGSGSCVSGAIRPGVGEGGRSRADDPPFGSDEADRAFQDQCFGLSRRWFEQQWWLAPSW
jgi:hypothetical protein